MTKQRPVWIIGGYQSDFARNFTKESLEIGDLVKETTTGTLADAGISAAQVQVVHVGNALGELYVKQGHLGSMVASVLPELSGVPATRHEAACASGGVAVMAAMADIESGRYDVALVLGVEIERNVPGAVGAGLPGAAAPGLATRGRDQARVWTFTFSKLRRSTTDATDSTMSICAGSPPRTSPTPRPIPRRRPAVGRRLRSASATPTTPTRRSSGGCGATTAARSPTAGPASSGLRPMAGAEPGDGQPARCADRGLGAHQCIALSL